MKKKLKDLTPQERDSICSKQHIKCSCLDEDLISCPLYKRGYGCMYGFIEKLRFVEKEIEVEE